MSLTWTAATSPIVGGGSHIGVAGSPNGTVIACWVDGSSVIHYSRSTDGCQSWTQVYSPTSAVGGLPAYSDGVFLVPNGTHVSRSTDDGVTWSSISLGGANVSPNLGIASDGAGHWVILDSTPNTATSSDNGVTWATHSISNVSVWAVLRALNWDGTQWTVRGQDGSGFRMAAQSSDGITWTVTDGGSPDSGGGIAFSGDAYILGTGSGGQSVYRATSFAALAAGGTSISVFPSDGFSITSCAYFDGVFLAAAFHGYIGSSSDDGVTWSYTSDLVSVSDRVFDFAYDSLHNLFVALSANGRLLTAPAPVSVPNVLGDTLAAATSAIVAAGFILGTVTSTPSLTVLPGLVSAQSPTGGTTATAGSPINVTIAQPAIAIAPTTANVQVNGGRQTFTPTAPAGSAFLWYVNGVLGGSVATGFVDGSGHYTAPVGVSSVPPPVTVTVALFEYPSTSASATVTLTIPGTVTVYGKCAFSGQTADGHVSTHFQGVFPPVVLPKPATINPKIIAPVINTTVKA